MKSGYHPNFPQYLVFEDGTVISSARGKPRKLTPKKISRGYLGLRIINAKGELQCIKHHRLVCTVFHGPCPEGHETRHLDGNRKHNNSANLRWGTRKENAADRIKHGTEKGWSNTGVAKLTPSQVKRMRKIRKTGVTFSVLAKMFNISESACHAAVTGEHWSHVR